MDGRNRRRILFYNAFLAYIDEQEQEHSYPVYIVRFPEKGELEGEGRNAEAVLRFKNEVSEEDVEKYMTTGTPVILKMDEGSGMNVYDGTVTYQLKSFIHVHNLAFRERLSRRGEKKVPMVESGVIYKKETGDETEIPVEFRNLSVGGIGLVLKDPETVIEENEFYYFYFEKAKTPIQLLFQVRWTRRMEDGRLSAGGQFVGVRSGHEELIRKYVFDVEREEILQQKEIADRMADMADMELQRKLLEKKAKEIQEEQEKKKGESGA